MKIRMKGNSIRLRLTQSEVRELGESTSIFETVDFGSSSFSYGLSIAGETLAASLDNNKITVNIPESKALNWINSDDEIGIEGESDLENGGKLHLLVEKDFVCLTDRPNEDESDNFPKPLAGTKC